MGTTQVKSDKSDIRTFMFWNGGMKSHERII